MSVRVLGEDAPFFSSREGIRDLPDLAVVALDEPLGDGEIRVRHTGRHAGRRLGVEGRLNNRVAPEEGLAGVGADAAVRHRVAIAAGHGQPARER